MMGKEERRRAERVSFQKKVRVLAQSRRETMELKLYFGVSFSSGVPSHTPARQGLHAACKKGSSRRFLVLCGYGRMTVVH